jgi:hypothetical protein
VGNYRRLSINDQQPSPPLLCSIIDFRLLPSIEPTICFCLTAEHNLATTSEEYHVTPHHITASGIGSFTG